MPLNQLNKPNILILLTDQQRHEQDPDWAVLYQPGMDRLKRNGLSFQNAFTSASACSPSRACILTGTYPDQHGVHHTIVLPGDASLGPTPAGYSQQPLLPTQPNLARMLKTAGYKVVWKGKWHLSLPVNGTQYWTEADIDYISEAYGFEEWNPNDAGNSIADIRTLGGGAFNNDGRFVGGDRSPGGLSSPQSQSALEFLQTYDPADGPFCLVVSIVNPHDVWVAPGFDPRSGYSESDIPRYGLHAPENSYEDLSTKPSAQGLYRFIYDAQTPGMENPDTQRTYVNFYAYLQTIADQHVMNILEELDNNGLTDTTLILRMSDHGEQGMAHGMREKMFSAYDETIHVPLIVSNPELFPVPRETEALVSWVDILPTLASVAGVYDQYEYVFRGVDLTPVIDKPETSVQELVHFCFDDGYLPLGVPPLIRAIRTHDWLYAVYFTANGKQFEYEMYDLQADPQENTNLAGLLRHEVQLRILHEKLQAKMKSAGTAPSGIPLVSPQLEDEVKLPQFDIRGLIPDPHWPTVEEAVEQSREQRQAETPDFEQLADTLEGIGFWMAVTRA